MVYNTFNGGVNLFGYVVANSCRLTEEQKRDYRECYCGLCKAIGSKCGQICRLTLTYDMTFLSLLLEGIYSLEREQKAERCPAHPLKKISFTRSEASCYAGAMNVLLAYYNLLDNWSDDRNVFSLAFARMIRRKKRRVETEYPRQSEAVKECLKRLSKAEKAGVLNPDIPSSIFGDLMGELFVWHEDENAEVLRKFGRALGRFIYIMDACLDFRDDLKKKKYNPMAQFSSADFEPTLTLLMGECSEIFEKIDIKANKELLLNIIYSGVWTRWEQAKRKEEKRR